MSTSAATPVRAEPAPRRKTKVAVLIPNLERGGAEQDVVRNFPRLNRDEFEVVVVLFDRPGALAPELERQGIPYVARRPDTAPMASRSTVAGGTAGAAETRESMADRTLQAIRTYPVLHPIHKLGSRIRFAAYVARVTWWVGGVFARERIDIAHFYLPHSYAYGMLGCALRCRRAKTVMSRLSLNYYREEQPHLAWLERQVLHRRVDIAIGNSKLILDELVQEGVPRDRVRLLYNGIDLTPFTRDTDARKRARQALGIDPSAFVIVAVGNLWAHKGHRDLIEACALAKDDLPSGWRLLIAGRDQEGNRAPYEDLVDERGLGTNVHLLGEYDNVPRLLFAADVFVQPSLHEGLPNAIIEAMAASLPVLATEVGGIPEVMTTESPEGEPPVQIGWLVPPGDPEALSRALVSAAAEPVRCEVMGARARARAEERFSVERSVRGYEAIYRELLR